MTSARKRTWSEDLPSSVWCWSKPKESFYLKKLAIWLGFAELSFCFQSEPKWRIFLKTLAMYFLYPATLHNQMEGINVKLLERMCCFSTTSAFQVAYYVDMVSAWSSCRIDVELEFSNLLCKTVNNTQCFRSVLAVVYVQTHQFQTNFSHRECSIL